MFYIQNKRCGSIDRCQQAYKGAPVFHEAVWDVNPELIGIKGIMNPAFLDYHYDVLGQEIPLVLRRQF